MHIVCRTFYSFMSTTFSSDYQLKPAALHPPLCLLKRLAHATVTLQVKIFVVFVESARTMQQKSAEYFNGDRPLQTRCTKICTGHNAFVPPSTNSLHLHLLHLHLASSKSARTQTNYSVIPASFSTTQENQFLTVWHKQLAHIPHEKWKRYCALRSIFSIFDKKCGAK